MNSSLPLFRILAAVVTYRDPYATLCPGGGDGPLVRSIRNPSAPRHRASPSTPGQNCGDVFTAETAESAEMKRVPPSV